MQNVSTNKYVVSRFEKLKVECNISIEHRINHNQPFYKDVIPKRPMERAAIITDYYSRFFEIFILEN